MSIKCNLMIASLYHCTLIMKNNVKIYNLKIQFKKKIQRSKIQKSQRSFIVKIGYDCTLLLFVHRKTR